MNITVGNYETKNFDIFPMAAAAFAESEVTEKMELAVLENAAKFVDSALGIMKKAMAVGTMNTHDLDELVADIDKAEELLDEIGELENHYYLQDSLEPMAMEMYDLSDIDPEDDAEDYHDAEGWMFGIEDRHDSDDY